MNVGGFRVSWLRRGWWVIAASVIGVVAVTLVISPPSSTVYTAESVLVIRSGATVNTPGSANEANRLAVTYAELIPQDIQVLERISRSLNVPTDVVEDHLDVVNDPSTSILRIRFTASRASVAVNGSRVAADALA